MWTQKIDLKWIDVNLTFSERWYENFGNEYLQNKITLWKI